MIKRFKRIVFIGLAIAFILSLSSCKISMLDNSNQTNIEIKENDEYSVPVPKKTGDYTITFVCNNGYVYKSYTDEKNKVLKPDNPSKRFATFLGWAKSTEYDELFNFNSVLTSNITLYAKYSLDYVKIYNEVETNSILSTVRIQTGDSIGSGVIVYEEANYYYCLTNHHVIYPFYSGHSVMVTDAYLRTVTGDIVVKDKNYDLALVRFRKEQKLKVIEIADYEVFKNEFVIAIGNPNGITNIVTSGYLVGKKENIPNQDTINLSNITFDIYYSNAKIDSGSSGGALLDSNLNLVGINFASAETVEKEYVATYTIPSAKVLEFLKLYTNYF